MVQLCHTIEGSCTRVTGLALLCDASVTYRNLATLYKLGTNVAYPY